MTFVSTHLLRGHERFQAEFASHEREFLKRLASEGQKPNALFVGCSDSRVIPEVLTNVKPGDLFVVRNVANAVPRSDAPNGRSVGAALEYGVQVLEVPHIVVCGHSGCGGVKAALGGRDAVSHMPSLFEWLENVEPSCVKAKSTGLTGKELEQYAIEENVLDQMLNLISYPFIRDAVDAGKLALHAWVYDLGGELTVYNAKTRNFDGYLQHLEEHSSQFLATSA